MTGIDDTEFRCEGLGDVNGDGYADFLLGVYNIHELQLYLGGTKPFDSAPVLTWPNLGYFNDWYSFSPENIGDIDCDGVNDFFGVFHVEDSLKIFFGLESLDTTQQLTLQIFEALLYRADGGSDNNNDGNNDFWIYKSGVQSDTIFGFTGCSEIDSQPDYYIFPSKEPSYRFYIPGLEFSSSYDLNGDSIPDVIYSQPSQDAGYPGRVCIIWGGESLSQEPDLIFYAPDTLGLFWNFGYDIALLNDISGDGIDDLLVNQYRYNYIYFGGQPFDTIPDIIVDWTLVAHDHVENIGDINNDGYDDVLFSNDNNLLSHTAILYCYPGMDTLIDVDFTDNDYYTALQVGSVGEFGGDRSSAGDVNGDGLNDFLNIGITGGFTGSQGVAVIQSGWQEPVATDDVPDNLPQTFSLEQNYPNPFNSGTTIDFTLSRGGYTEVVIYNILSEVVATPLAKHMPAGEHRIQWDGKDTVGNPTATGVYFYRITSGDFTETKKMVLLK
ncbi:MAG: T9SS type A sorting domain-containing protein [Candidatus Zixiibacteriota bacterium]